MFKLDLKVNETSEPKVCLHLELTYLSSSTKRSLLGMNYSILDPEEFRYSNVPLAVVLMEQQRCQLHLERQLFSFVLTILFRYSTDLDKSLYFSSSYFCHYYSPFKCSI